MEKNEVRPAMLLWQRYPPREGNTWVDGGRSVAVDGDLPAPVSGVETGLFVDIDLILALVNGKRIEFVCKIIDVLGCVNSPRDI